MKQTLVLFLILISSGIWASPKLDIRPGDIILQPLNCWLCSLIELEEGSKFSHMGVVLSVTPEILVGEAYGTVKKTTLAEFLSKTEKGQNSILIRFRNEVLARHLQNTSSEFLRTFETQFEGAPYDSDFLWNNFDENWNEKLYCSEMIAKLLKVYVQVEAPIKRMQYKKYWDHWMVYFKGNVPENKWGNSPGDFEKSELFYTVGEL